MRLDPVEYDNEYVSLEYKRYNQWRIVLGDNEGGRMKIIF